MSLKDLVARRAYKRAWALRNKNRLRFLALKRRPPKTERRNSSTASIRPRIDRTKKRDLDESSFDAITEQSSYWAGFLMADGCVYKNAVIVALSYADEAHLRKFRSFLKSNSPVVLRAPGKNAYGRTPMAHFSFHSATVVLALARYGVVQDKTSRTLASGGVETDRHFWRGVVDGDGSLWVDGQCRANLQLVGSRGLLEQFLGFINSFRATTATVRPHKSVWRVAVCGLTALAVIRKLYEDCSISLGRKMKKACQALEEC